MRPRRRTRPELAYLLKLAAEHKMTPQELWAQRRSWVAGQIALSADITLEEDLLSR